MSVLASVADSYGINGMQLNVHGFHTLGFSAAVSAMINWKVLEDMHCGYSSLGEHHTRVPQ